MLRKPVFWIVFVVLSIISGIIAIQFFSDAFPIVSLEIQMDRETALNDAQILAENNKWGPIDFEIAASFGVNSTVQNFVELEAGGVEAFKQMLKGELYSPYTWKVRLFKENETNEAMIRFTPEGQFYGFYEKLSEETPGAALSADSALTIARQIAEQKWELKLNEYELAEQSQEVRPSERIDHTFTFERPDQTIGEGRYRLKLVLSGDELSEMTHLVKVPEAFEKRFEEMRSANDTIATVAVIFIGILYVLGGVVFGIYYLLRERWLLWKKALFWGIFIALLQVLTTINSWPLAWMGYDTALSAQGFLMQQIMQLVLTFIALSALMTGVFIAAEGLTRKAFPNHIRFWNLWSKKTASSPEVLGQTLSGYLTVTIFFAFDIGLYFIANRVLGWWSPSGALFDPNVLATYFPWLSSIAISLQAGFMEECLFRAIPIAGAVLLGNRFGNRKLWIIGAFILQAVIFGAGHANYPNQPAYARVVELIIPSIGFGLIYWFFGLLPVIILHFVYDVVWFALPLFVSQASDVMLDQILVIILSAIPLLIVFLAWLRHRKWEPVSEDERNKSFEPQPASLNDEPAITVLESKKLSPAMQRSIAIFGIVGISIWLIFTNFQNVTGYLHIDRNTAEKIATEYLADYGFEFNEPWQTMSTIIEPKDQDDRFIWKTAGEIEYAQLLGTYLNEPHWLVRFARFKGTIEERSEEFKIYISKTGEIIREQHILPETMASDSLEADSARVLAHGYLSSWFNLKAQDLKEISATPEKLPNRTDWIFTFSDTASYPLEEGEARIDIKIAGDHIVDAYKYVYVPEEWARAERSELNSFNIFRGATGLVRLLLLITASVLAIVFWSRKQFAAMTFVIFVLIVFFANFINMFNGYFIRTVDFSTAQPIANQRVTAFGLPIIGYLFISAIIALMAGFIARWKREQKELELSQSIMTGLAAGFFIAGVLAVIARFEPLYQPFWPDFRSYALAIPFLDGLSSLHGFLLTTVLYLFIYSALDRFTEGWTKKLWLYAPLFVLIILMLTQPTAPGFGFWLALGLIKGVIYLLMYVFIFRYHLSLVPIVFAAITLLSEIKVAIIGAIPSAIAATIFAVLIIFGMALYWNRNLQKK